MTKTVQWAVSLALIVVLVLLVDVGEVYRALRSADPRYLALGVALMLGDRLLMAGKWLPLLRIQHPDVTAARAVRSYFAASFAALLLPASVGGDALRAYGLGKDRGSVMEVGASVVFERVLGLAGSGIVALVALWLAFRSGLPMEFLLPWAAGCAAVGFLAATIPFSPGARRWLKRLLGLFEGRGWVEHVERFGSAYALYRGHVPTLVVVGILSVLEQLVPVLVFWAVAHALGISVPLEALLVSVPLSLFAARIPVGVAGIGILEGGMIYLLGLYGVSGAQALSLTLAGRFVEFVAVFPGVFWWRELTGRADVLAAPEEGR